MIKKTNALGPENRVFCGPAGRKAFCAAKGANRWRTVCDTHVWYLITTTP